MTLQLFDLPQEILLRIICFLDTDELHLLKHTNAALGCMISNSLGLQYRLFAAAVGVQNNEYSRHDVLERRDLLKTRVEGWYNMWFDFKQTIPYPQPFSSIYDLTGGIYFKGDKGRKAIHWCSLPSRPSDVCVWKQVHVDKPLVDIGVNVLEHDLIAILTFAPHSTAPSLNVIEVFLHQLSTGNRHPLAKIPVLFIAETQALRPSILIEIVGDYLVLVMSQDAHEEGGLDTLCVYEWKTGVRKMYIQYPYHIYHDVIFLSPSLILLPNYRHNTLDVWELPVGGQPSATEPFLALALPGLSPDTLAVNINCRAELNPSPSGTPYSQSPFHDTPEDAIVIFNVTLDSIDGTRSSYQLFVHRAALLKTVLTRRREDEMGVTHYLPSTLELGIVPGQRVRAWVDWGPDISRVLNSTGNPLGLITTSAGQRAIYTGDTESTGTVFDWRYTMLMDFNPSTMKRLIWEATSGLSEQAPHWIAWDPSEVLIPGLAEPVITKLRYVAVDLPFEPAWVSRCRGVIIDEERIIILLRGRNDLTTMQVLHMGISRQQEPPTEHIT